MTRHDRRSRVWLRTARTISGWLQQLSNLCPICGESREKWQVMGRLDVIAAEAGSTNRTGSQSVTGGLPTTALRPSDHMLKQKRVMHPRGMHAEGSPAVRPDEASFSGAFRETPKASTVRPRHSCLEDLLPAWISARFPSSHGRHRQACLGCGAWPQTLRSGQPRGRLPGDACLSTTRHRPRAALWLPRPAWDRGMASIPRSVQPWGRA